MSQGPPAAGPDPVEDVYDRIADAVFALDEDWRFTFLNDEAERLLERDEADLIGKVVWDEFPEAVGSTFQEEYERAMQTQEPVSFDEYYAPLGTWFEVRAYPSPTGLSVYFHDVTERIERRRRLREREQALRDAYGIIADRERSLAAKIELLLDVGREALRTEIGVLSRVDLDADRYTVETAKAPEEVTLPVGGDVRASDLPTCERVVRSGETLAVADVGQGSDRLGIRAYLGTPVHVDGEVYGTFCFFSREPREEPFTDWEIAFANLLSNWVSAELARNQRERDLERSNERLEASNRRLERFTRAASHDMQEPARSVATHLQVVRERYGDTLGEDGIQHLDFALEAALQMRARVRGLSSYAEIETGETEMTPVDLDEVIADVMTARSAALHARDGQITVAELPTVRGDRGQLTRLFAHLLDNAIRYSGEAPPQIHIDAHEQDGWQIVTVADEGVGIAQAYQRRVFDLFERLGRGTDGPAAGLGLAICERIVERHGGEIRVDSESEGGSRFAVRLPAAGGEADIEPPPPPDRRSLVG